MLLKQRTKIYLFLFIPLFLFMTSMTQAAPSIDYYISMEQPHTHIFEVEMKINGWEKETIDIKMAVWTPGSYLVREFARKVQELTFENTNGKDIDFQKVSKNTWQADTKGHTNFSIKYKVYSYEWTVRTSIMDASHAYINGASMFMFIKDMLDLPATLHIKPYKDWKTISTALKPVNKSDKWTLHSPNFDILADSPIEIGNHKVINFSAAGIPHKFAIYGEGNYDEKALVNDTRKIVEEATNVFGTNPCDDYTIIIHNTEKSYGGLEHLTSTSLIYPRWNYQPKSRYTRWLGLMSHEYFHLWNVKRIRPMALGPFDYENENYTHLLWVMEGTTSYYDDLLLRRADLIDAKKYLNIVSSNINTLENKPGKNIQSVADASFDAWIKYYRSDEHSNNCCVSYYNKGAVLSTILDLEIRHSTDGQKNMDDLMQYLYFTYYKRQQRGFTNEEYKAAVEELIGKKMDDFFDNYVFGTKDIDYNKYFGYVGLKAVNTRANNKDLALGLNLSVDKGKLMVSQVKTGSCGHNHGINVKDELIAIDNYRTDDTGDIQKVLALHKAGDFVPVLVCRNGKLETLQVKLTANTAVDYELKKLENPSEDQTKLYNAWLKLN